MKSEEEKYAELIISMSTDFLIGKINFDLYASNLNVINKNIQKMNYEDNQRMADDILDKFLE